MINTKLKTILVLCFIITVGAGCSNSLDTGDTESLSTVISYSMSEETHVKLWVENSYNTTVATLVDEVQQAGSHNVTFDAVDSNGNNLPEGLYIYRIETDSESLTRVLHLFYR